ncbi:MAG TPA: exo-alpha-sialidase, partial [Bacillota bacterium]|nr:exo-alpha-sialidase [Bacillota bacterium]
ALATERHEQSARIFPIDYDRSTVSDLGYTGWVQFDDGEVYVVNYLVDDAPKAYIRASAFYPEEFTINT